MPQLTPAFLDSVHHDGSSRYVRARAGAALRLGDKVTLRLRAAVGAPLERLLLRTCPDGEQSFVEMQPEVLQPGAACRWWQVKLRLSMPVTHYRFLVFSSGSTWWYNGSGLHRHIPTDAEDFRLLAGYTAPAWVRSSVFYQIFPDRFADGDPASNIRDGEFEYQGLPARARRWGEPPAQWPEAMVEFYGGDLPGVEQKLDYLADLGINAIYFNPLFTAYSNHRYDVVDYRNVDPHLGGNAALLSLRRAASKRKMRFILDIVPNHCGILHPWFQAALADPNAPTAAYFTFHRHPDRYESWLGVQSLPRLNYRSQALRAEMYAAPDSIFRHWLKKPYAIDGWRVDVANMLARSGPDQLQGEILSAVRSAVKAENPEAYLLGEHFFDGTSQLQGSGLDATMNYAGFTHPFLYWLDQPRVGLHTGPVPVPAPEPPVLWPTGALVDTWQASRAAIPWVIARQQFNLLGSHDTPRIQDILKFNPALNRLAAAFLMTYVGVPCIYYGDEIGMHGKNTLAARSCMLWDPAAWDGELRSFYQTLIRLRRRSPALIEGGFQVLFQDDQLLAFLRDSDEEQIIVVGNRGPGQRPAAPLPVAHGGIPDGTAFKECFTHQLSTVTLGALPLPLLPPGVQVWQSL